jgi:hypothetical protein
VGWHYALMQTLYGENFMLDDLLYLGLTIVFFLLSLAYVRGCEKLQ